MSKFLSIFLFLALILGCAPPKNITNSKYPVDEFILIHKNMSVEVCNYLIKNCFDDKLQGSGSGVVIKHEGSKSYVLTAEHVCTAKLGKTPIFIKLVLKDSELEITDSKNNTKKATIVATDKRHDLCILETERLKVPAIKVALSSPRRYQKIYNVAAPRGVWQKDNALFFQGRFSGYDKEGEATYILDAMPGSSGSPIVNEQGRLVGIVCKVLVPGYTVVYGPNLIYIKKLMKKAFDE